MNWNGKSNREPSTAVSPPASTALKFVSWSCVAISLTAFWGIGQFHVFDNTINGYHFFLQYAFAGLLLSAPLYVLLHRTVPELKEGRKIARHWSTKLVGLGFGFTFLTPGIASRINRDNLAGTEYCAAYRIQKGSSAGKSKEYYLFANIRGNEERITVNKYLWEKLQNNQSITICLQKGILGFDNIKLPR